MNILFDQGVPAPLRTHLTGHAIATAFEQGWSTLTNGELLQAAEAAEFELLMTTDQKLKHQQNLAQRTIAISVLGSTSWPKMKERVSAIVDAVARIQRGEYVEVAI